MDALKSVSCVEIGAHNIDQYWDELMLANNNCYFVALDLELSGLGNRPDLSAKQIDDRYRSVSETAKSRSVLSLGLCFFNECQNSDAKSNDTESNSNVDKLTAQQLCDDSQSDSTARQTALVTNEWQLNVEVFNFLCLCQQEYVVEPETLRFLVEHGFDFNRQCLYGLPYHRGNDSEYEDRNKPSLRNLISQIIKWKIPIVVHNGFIDLIFLYQHFYCDLPNELQSFISDLTEIFPSGIYDTKYIADFHQRFSRSYLEYLFYTRQRFNIERLMKGQTCVRISFPLFSDVSNIEYRDLSTKLMSNVSLDVDICNDYAYHGWCRHNNSCPKSHNIDYILDKKKKNQSKRMKKKLKHLKKVSDQQTTEILNCGDSLSVNLNSSHLIHSKQGIHKAGYDAFMTGFCFSSFIASLSKQKPDFQLPLIADRYGLSHIVNNINLTGKDQSLRIKSSSFSKPSIPHKNKILNLRCDN